MGAQGTAELDFGAFPGASDAVVDVVTAGVVVTSLVEAWIKPVATADHSADEHMLETLKVFGTYLSDNNLRIYGFNTSEIFEPVSMDLSRGAGDGSRPPENIKHGQGGIGTRIYGRFNVAWVWN